MGKPRDTKIAILPSTTRKGTTLSTSAALDSPSVISKLVSPPQASNAGTSAESENSSHNCDDASAVLDNDGSLGSFLDATIARSRQIENTETPNENAATPVNSPESVEYSSDDLDEDYVELDDDFIEKCNATTDARKIKKLLAEHAVRYKLSPDPKFATSPINIKDKDYDFSLDLSHIAIVEKTPFCGTEKESAVEHMIEKRTPDDAEELLAKIGRNHDDWSTPEPTPTPILKKRGMIKLNDEDMREAKKSLKEKGIKPEDVKNLPPIEDLCKITPPSSMIEDPLYPEGHPKRVEQDSQLTKTSAPSKKKKKKHKNVVESSEPVNDPNSISISDAETESGNEHDKDNDKNDTPDKEEVEEEPEKHAKNKKYTKEDFIAEKHGNEREPWVQKQMPFPAKKLKSKEEEHYNKFCDWMKPLFLQIPLTDAIKLPPYSKYMKDIVSNKRKIPNEEISTMLANYSFNGKIPKKLGDPDKLIPTDISLQMADKSTAIPVGVCENVPVQVTQHCLILTDFVVLEMPEDDNMSIILGRPFLNTAGAVIDCNKGMVTFNVDDKEHTVYFPKRIDKKRKMKKFNFGELFKRGTTSTGRPSRASTQIRRSYNEDIIAPSFAPEEDNGAPNASSFPCYDFLTNAGILDDFFTLVNRAGLATYVGDEREQYYMLTKIFVESFKFHNTQYEPTVAFKIYGNPVTMELEEFCRALDIAPVGTARRIDDNPRDLLELYRGITDDDCRTIQRGKIRNIQLPAIKYFAYYIATSILGRENTSNISSYHLAFLNAALTGQTSYHLGSLIARRLSNRGPIFGGTIALRILTHLRLPLDPNDVPLTPRRLDIAAMKSHHFVTTDSTVDNMVYRMLFADGDEKEIPLPQPGLFNIDRQSWSRTKEEVEEHMKIQDFHQQHDSEDAEPSYDCTVTYPDASSSTYLEPGRSSSYYGDTTSWGPWE
ncbi:hypothetical protein QYE76_011160 [Lolium multiflorum]|uniref:Arabidopsis retrotransposon Orf1 C-terminal domain-containing protein n=1 Tax=Lolium multiflorum TaxID=4521 RepID=A0AAD8TYF6_LOLMU|nr:hypothetical protein QYE76_011160 [Lolium multiflorum]